MDTQAQGAMVVGGNTVVQQAPDVSQSSIEKSALVAAIAPGTRRARRVLFIVGVCAALLSLGGLIGATFVKSPEQLRADAEGPARSVLTSPVERRVLKSTVIVRGVVGAGRQVEFTPVAAQGAAASVVTAVRVKQGGSVRDGDVVLSVSGRPLIVLAGSVPSYRDLVPNSDGDDVVQLQAALRRLALYSGGDVKGHFGAATKAAVKGLYKRVGFAVPEVGAPDRDSGNALRAADDAVAAAQQAVDVIQTQIADSPGATTPPGSPSLQRQLTAAQTVLARAQADRTSIIANTGPMVPFSEVAFIPTLPAVVTKFTAEVGDPVKAPLVVFATGALRIVAHVQPDTATMLRQGMKVDVASESLGQSVYGVIAAVGERTTEAGQDGQVGAPFVPVTVAPSEGLSNEWNGLDVRLTVIAAQTSGEVLAVPLSAVSAGADGKTTLTVLGPGGKQTLVEVRVGLSADGFVEIEPAGATVLPGDQVVVGQ